MKDFLGCCLFSMLFGAGLAAVLVTKNKDVRNAVKTGTTLVENKVEAVKDSIEKAKKGNK